jgi:hypothetical protein
MPFTLRSDSLTTTHLEFTVKTSTPLELDVYSGAALRGNFFNAIWQRFCTNKSALTCATCPLHVTCPVSTLVAPLREEDARGQDIPRPYIIVPPHDGQVLSRRRTLLLRYDADRQHCAAFALYPALNELPGDERSGTPP